MEELGYQQNDRKAIEGRLGGMDPIFGALIPSLMNKRPDVYVPEPPRRVQDWQWALGIGGVFFFAIYWMIVKR